LVAAALQAAWREVERCGELFQAEAGGMHYLLDDGLGKALADGCPKLGLGAQRTAQRGFPAELFEHGVELIDHSVT